MKKILSHLYQQLSLSEKEAYDIFKAIANNEYNEAQVVAFINVFMMRKIKVEEFIGFRNALMDLAKKIDLEERQCMDIVGTGGDEKNTFNISTLSCFVAVGAGVKISKHGNYAASSISGSSNVMEYFGYKFSADADKIKKEIDDYGITFLHAPFFHPALKSVAGIRKNLKVRTFFNQLGPLVNPCQPLYNVIGVYHLEVMRLYQYALQKMDKQYLLLHSLDGYDEISLTDDAKIISPKIERLYATNEMSALRILPQHLLGGESVADAAKIFINVLENNATREQKEVVVVNTAFALMSYGLAKNLEEGKYLASASLDSKQAYQVFKKMMAGQVV